MAGELSSPSSLLRLKGTLSRPGSLSGTLKLGPYGIPMINGVPLVGDISLPQLGLRGIYYDTTENWNAQTDFIGKDGSIYIYSDYATKTTDDGKTVPLPSIKIGDGSTPLIDSPFITVELASTIVETMADEVVNKLQDRNLLVTPEDRQNWDNKVTCTMLPTNNGNLIFTY